MPYENHSRLVASGVILDGAGTTVLEEWAWSVALVQSAGSAFVTAPQRAAIAAAVQVFHASGGASIAPRCHLRSIKVNDFGPAGGGKVAQQNLATNEVVVDVPGGGGGGGAPRWPLQCAVAVSLDTGLRGGSRRGRFYLPPLGGPDTITTSSYRLHPDWTHSIALAASDMLNAFLLGGVRPVVASGVVGNTPITSVRVGSVIDTLRTRRNNLLEAYDVQPVG